MLTARSDGWRFRATSRRPDRIRTATTGARAGWCVKDDDERRYVEYVSNRLIWLPKIAFLLCQDWHRADDLAQAAIARLTCTGAWRLGRRTLTATRGACWYRESLSSRRTGGGPGRELTDQAQWPLSIFVCDAATGETAASGEPDTTVDGYPARAGTHPFRCVVPRDVQCERRLRGHADTGHRVRCRRWTAGAVPGDRVLRRPGRLAVAIGQCRKRTEDRAMSTVNFQLS